MWPRVDPPDKSGGKTGASLLTAALDDVASGGSGHTGKESEPAFTAAVGGLESSFHFLFVLFFSCFVMYFNYPQTSHLKGILRHYILSIS